MSEPQNLYLYGFQSCPWCARVRSAIADLGLDVEELDIHQVSEHREALVAAMGRKTVPVLRIGSGEGARWLPESADIVDYLYKTHGQGGKPPFFASALPQRIGIGVGLALFVGSFFVADQLSVWFLVAAVGCWVLGRHAVLVGKLFR